MYIFLETEIGLKRIINSQEVFFVEGTGESACRVYLKQTPDMPVRLSISIEDFYKVLKGEADFFSFYKTKGVFAAYQDDSLQKAGFLKDGKSSPEEIAKVQEEFIKEGRKLVSGTFKEVKEEVKSEPIPSFSKKKKPEPVAAKPERSNVW